MWYSALQMILTNIVARNFCFQEDSVQYLSKS
jgi:hypothetical protein